MSGAAARIEALRYDYPTSRALAGIDSVIRSGIITGLVGPDGAGKTTLLRLLAGLLRPSAGRVIVLGHDMASEAALAHPAIGYMPQRFGLYEDLSVAENLSLFADLHRMTAALRAERIARLLRFTGLAPFTARLAGQLSGGMKQKLGLACALLARPRLLLLDEPSVGVDPLSRRELWSIVSAMLDEGRAEGMAVVWATAYLDEAARCGRVLLLHEGALLADLPPDEFLAPLAGRVFRLATGQSRRALADEIARRPDVLDAIIEGDGVRLVIRANTAPPPGATPIAPRFEDGFVARLGTAVAPQPPITASRHAGYQQPGATAIDAHHLVRRFGDFTAVDDVSFSVARGEIFGLLGPNGAGKSTIFRMLCGLLRPTGGTALVAGEDLLRAAAAARARIGYMAQRFSLYPELSVRENLRFFARVYGLRGAARAAAIDQAIERFDLPAAAVSGELPLGVKQRLALAAALLHGPDILFLDEPTSGVDPLTRRTFWRRIGALADAGMAVLVTTHFMDEAEYCDRLAIIDGGRVIATGTPAALRDRARSAANPDPTLEDAFIALLHTADHRAAA